MTAVAVVEKPHMLATYKKGHELEGIVIERGHQCGCGRWFNQQVISRKWLNTLEPERCKGFLDTCEIEDLMVGSRVAKIVWFPRKCWGCERRKIDSDAAVHDASR